MIKVKSILNTEYITCKATEALLKLDDSFVGTPDYLGIAYFWHSDYKHILRAMSYAIRRKVHNALLAANLDVSTVSELHEQIINKYTQRYLK